MNSLEGKNRLALIRVETSVYGTLLIQPSLLKAPWGLHCSGTSRHAESPSLDAVCVCSPETAASVRLCALGMNLFVVTGAAAVVVQHVASNTVLGLDRALTRHLHQY